MTINSIFIMAYITLRIIKKEEISTDDMLNNEEENILNVNEKYCIGYVMYKLLLDDFVMLNKKQRMLRI